MRIGRDRFVLKVVGHVWISLWSDTGRPYATSGVKTTPARRIGSRDDDGTRRYFQKMRLSRSAAVPSGSATLNVPSAVAET